MIKNVLVTGGFGFIGSDFIKLIFEEFTFKKIEFKIYCVDKMTYAASYENLPQTIRSNENFIHLKYDICDDEVLVLIKNIKFDFCVNFAAESHVDNSIESPIEFVRTNVLGTANLLNGWRNHQESRFIQIGTDEVYGSVSKGSSYEDDQLKPSSAYSSSKASADLIAQSFKHTYGMDIVVTRCTNNFGPNQNSEKLIPKMIMSYISGKDLEIYGSGQNIREWIYVRDHSLAIQAILNKSKLKFSLYNIGSNTELTNLNIVNALSQFFPDSKSKVKLVKDRLGHDFRYSLNSDRIREELDWKPIFAFEEGLRVTVESYLN